MSLFRLVPTGLDLNGPDLSFTTNPIGVAASTAGIATFTGIATATFATVGSVSNSVNNLGIITYRWWKVGLGSLTDGTTSAGNTISGAGTTILTLSSLSNDINQGEYYLQADYVPEYISGVTSVSLGGALTGNAPNEPLNSGIGTLTVYPEITIVTQPQEETVATGATHTFSLYATASDNTNDNLSYEWQQDGTALTNSSTVAGAGTTELSISSTTIGVSTIRCKVTHPTANPSPVYSDVVEYDVTEARNIIKYECFSENSTTLNSTGTVDLSEGALSFRADTSAATRSITIYPSETNSEVKITMGGSRGDSQSGRRRGHGGISVFKITLLKDTEYTIKLGVPYSANLAPQGGNPGGGGLAVLYRKANVIAVCGGGGGAGTLGRGGDGGGVGLAGEGGQGINGGGGGEQILTGAMPTEGSYAKDYFGATNTTVVNFSSDNNEGGFLSKCTQGDYYAEQGYAPCQDLGNVQARTYDGDIITGSATIERGYKAGFGYRENGGNGLNENSGGGGAGARGGDGPTLGGNGGGGGGSGYSNGEITLLTSTTLSTGTRVGGNDDTAFIVIESTDEASDNEPVFPAASSI
tara:strand:+ start:1281 stop:3029 length:1749 start_codon:yes stop_codon:yes gene_type:complete